ncbi:MAG: EAL domain-containing protein [Bacillota bacterium]
MSLKKKLSIIFALVVTAVLILNNTLFYITTETLLRKDQEKQMELMAKAIGITIEHSNYGAQYVEDLIGEKLRFAAVAAQYALNKDIDKVTDEQLEEVSNKVGVSYITLLKRVDEDIKGVKSSDPKERNMSTKDWGYWFTAFEQLLDHQNVTIPEGQKLKNYWSGPMNTSYTNPDHVAKWGYYYDGTTNYIINPAVWDSQIMNFKQEVGADSIVTKALESNDALLEITGFNPQTFGKPPIYTETDGQKYIDFVNQEIQFGKYSYQDKENDVRIVSEVMATGKLMSVEAVISGKKVLKSFIPIIQSETPYVIGIVTDYEIIQGVLNKQLFNNVIISIIVLLFVIGFSYLLAAYIVKPVNRILRKVNEIAKGNFGAQLSIDRKDELGMLSVQVNTMSRNLDNSTKELKEKNAEIEYQAYHDFLTGLPNLRYLTNQFNEELQRSETMAVIFVDLDRFKMINDMFGHTVGDFLLKSVANRIVEHTEENGTVARIGGDEFIVLIPNYNRELSASKAQELLKVLAMPFVYMGNELFVTPSIGISLYPTDGDHADKLVKNSDIAMYRAKEQGRNTYQFYEPEMNDFIYKRAQLEQGLRKALELNEFTLLFQPQIDLNAGKIIGNEALIRWKHGVAGMISPADFIPLSEETGLIVPIGEWVLRKACEQNVAWQKAGFPPMRVSVNLSARQFQQMNLVENVTEILSETGLDPQYLELEITESIAMHNEEYVIAKLNALKTLGIRIAMDDFGTGYSSLGYLNKLPIDTLKIDKSFLGDIKEGLNSEICATIIAMARNMNLNVIAEGVETKEQLDFLFQHKCKEAQGYLFSKPVSADEFVLTYLSIQEIAAGNVDKG